MRGEQASAARTAYVVMGPHRSGTSSMARVLSLAGVRLPRDLVASHPEDNPTGYWESRSVIQLNDAILEEWGGSWSAPPAAGEVSPESLQRAEWVLRRMFPQQGSIVLKDPRLSLTGRFWAEMLERDGFRPFFIVMHREPSEVMASSCRSYGLDSDAALALWRTYARRALDTAAAGPHAVVSYPALLEDAQGVVRRLGLPEPAGGWSEFTGKTSAFLSPTLHRQRLAPGAVSLGGVDESLRGELDHLAARGAVTPTVSPAGAASTRAAPAVTWLLISGAPRSGTTLLRALVDEHPDASILQEFGLTRFVRSLDALVGRPTAIRASWQAFAEGDTSLAQAAAFYTEREAAGGAGSRGDLAAVPFDTLAQGLFGALGGDHPRVVGDKMPMRGEWEDIDYLLQRLPELRLLVILRNPRAVIHSSMIRRARRRLGGDLWPIESVQEAAEEWWLAWVHAAGLAERFGPAIRFVKYEALCADAGGVMQEVWDWLGLTACAPAIPVRRLPASVDALSLEEAGVVDNLLGQVASAWDEEPDPRRLIARFADLARPYVPGRRLQAASEAADAVLVDGFSWREPWGRWTDGERAVLCIRHGLADGRGILELKVARAFVPEGGACHVVVQVQGSPPQLFDLAEGGGRLSLLCSLQTPATPGVLEVELLILNPKGALDMPSDDRRLGLGLESVSLRVLP